MKPEDLTRWREAMELSQEDAADLLGFSREHVNRLENGAKEIQPLLPYALAAIYCNLKPWPKCR